MKIIIYYLSLILLLGTLACTKIKTEIPAELQDNEQAVEYLTELNKNITKFNKLTIDLAEITGGRDITSGDSLSKMQILKLAKTGGQFMLVSKKLEELIESKPVIEGILNAEQLIVFRNKSANIENKMGNIDLSELDLSEEQLAELKQKFEENKTYNQQKRAYQDSIRALQQDTISSSSVENIIQGKNVDHNPSKKKKIVFFIAFGIVSLAIIGGTIFFIILLIRKIRSIR